MYGMTFYTVMVSLIPSLHYQLFFTCCKKSRILHLQLFQAGGGTGNEASHGSRLAVFSVQNTTMHGKSLQHYFLLRVNE